jgi:hypothetical protein
MPTSTVQPFSSTAVAGSSSTELRPSPIERGLITVSDDVVIWNLDNTETEEVPSVHKDPKSHFSITGKRVHRLHQLTFDDDPSAPTTHNSSSAVLKRVTATLLIDNDFMLTHPGYQPPEDKETTRTWLVVAYQGGKVRIWDLCTGECICVFDHYCPYPTTNEEDDDQPTNDTYDRSAMSLLQLGDGRLVTAGKDGCVRIWKLQKKRVEDNHMVHGKDRVEQVHALGHEPTDQVLSLEQKESEEKQQANSAKPFLEGICVKELQWPKSVRNLNLEPTLLYDTSRPQGSISIIIQLPDGKLLAQGAQGICIWSPSQL